MAILVIPQSLGYAALAGLPPIMGLYASIVPTLIYAYIGSSNINALGPVAITAIMTASALSPYASGSLQYISLAVTLAFMVGLVLCLANVLKLGWIMQFVSRGVCSGFISAAAILIVVSQLKNLIGIPLTGEGLVEMLQNLKNATSLIHPHTAWLGLGSLALLMASRHIKALWAWLPKQHVDFAKRLFVIIMCIICIIMARHYDWGAFDIRLLKPLPTSLADIQLPSLSVSILLDLMPSAILIALIAFISSAAVAGNYARLHAQKFDNNKELLGLGLANIGSGLFGGFAVAGGISRTSLNMALGARTPLASVVCAVGILLILLFFGRYMTGLPYALLSAIIISSVLSMVDVQTLKSAWRHDKADAVSLIITFITSITLGLNFGLVIGLLTSFALMIYRSHRVNVAIIGQVGNSQHFRDIKRHQAHTFSNLLLLRVDESLYFGNAATVRDTIRAIYDDHRQITDVVLIMTAINHIDLAAQEMLMDLNKEISSHGKRLHFAEVKGPVMDILKDGPVLASLSGELFLSTNMAVDKLKYKGVDWGGM